MKNEQTLSFMLTKEIYERDFFPVYNINESHPKTFIVFEVDLPFHIPMKVSKTFTLPYEDKYLSFRFDMITTNESYKYSICEDEPRLNVHKTKIHMMLASDVEYQAFIENRGQYYNEYFDLLLEELNKLVLSYMISIKDDDCHYLTKEMFPTSIITISTNLETWENDMSLFMLHINAPFEKEPLTDDDMMNVLRMMSVVTYDMNPFAYGQQFIYAAKRYLNRGFYLEAVIFAQTSIEVLLRTLLEELMRFEGKNEEEVENKLEDTAFMTIVKRILPTYLGGNWDISNKTSAVGKWYNNTYMLRNKGTHRGRIPTFIEVNEAIDDTLGFNQFIVERVKANKKKYPKLNEYFV